MNDSLVQQRPPPAVGYQRSHSRSQPNLLNFGATATGGEVTTTTPSWPQDSILLALSNDDTASTSSTITTAFDAQKRRLSNSETALAAARDFGYHFHLHDYTRGIVGVPPPPPPPSHNEYEQKTVMPPPVAVPVQQPTTSSKRFFDSSVFRDFAPANWLFRQKLPDSKDDLHRESVLESIKY